MRTYIIARQGDVLRVHWQEGQRAGTLAVVWIGWPFTWETAPPAGVKRSNDYAAAEAILRDAVPNHGMPPLIWADFIDQFLPVAGEEMRTVRADVVGAWAHGWAACYCHDWEFTAGHPIDPPMSEGGI